MAKTRTMSTATSREEDWVCRFSGSPQKAVRCSHTARRSPGICRRFSSCLQCTGDALALKIDFFYGRNRRSALENGREVCRTVARSSGRLAAEEFLNASSARCGRGSNPFSRGPRVNVETRPSSPSALLGRTSRLNPQPVAGARGRRYKVHPWQSIQSACAWSPLAYALTFTRNGDS